MHECPLYGEPELYDLLFPDPRHVNYLDDEKRGQRLAASERFYLSAARQSSGRVLELACGSGRLSIPIAKAGIEIVGLDSSQPMLDAARSKAAAAAANLVLVQADMRSFQLAERFSTILMAGNSLLHLLKIEDLRHCLENIQRHLVPGGQFVFDVVNPNLQLLTRDSTRRYPVLRVRDLSRGEITVEEIVRYDGADQINHVTWYMSSDGNPDFRVVEYRLRVIFPQELQILLECAGLRIKTKYGEFTREPFSSSSPRQLCICEPC